MNYGKIAQAAVASAFLVMFSFAVYQTSRQSRNQAVIAPDTTPAPDASTAPETLNPLDFGLPETAKELPERRTEKSATFEIAPGKFAAVSHGQPMFFKNEQGQFILIKQAGEEQNESFVFNRLAGGVKIVFDLQQPQYTLTWPEGTITVRFDSQAAGQVANANSVTYPLDDTVTLTWSVIDNRVHQELAVKASTASPDISFTINHPDSFTLANKDNMIFLLNREGHIGLRWLAPEAVDTNDKASRSPITLQATDNRYTYLLSAAALPPEYRISHRQQ